MYVIYLYLAFEPTAPSGFQFNLCKAILCKNILLCLLLLFPNLFCTNFFHIFFPGQKFNHETFYYTFFVITTPSIIKKGGSGISISILTYGLGVMAWACTHNMRVVLVQCAQYCPCEASEQKMDRKPKTYKNEIELSCLHHSIDHFDVVVCQNRSTAQDCVPVTSQI